MTNFFSSIMCWIAGASKSEISKYDRESQNHVQLLGTLVLIPTALWFITGYLLMSKIFYASQIISICSAIVLSSLIFIIDRSIILAGKGKFIIFLRVALGFLIAFAGALFIDTLIFGSDIEAVAIKNYKVEQSKILDSLNTSYQKASENYFIEMNGTGGSKKKGFGKITEAKGIEKDKIDGARKLFEDQFNNELMILNDLNHPEHKLMISKLGLLSLSNRIDLFDDLKQTNSNVYNMWLTIFIIMVILEALPALIKSFSEDTAYELDCRAKKDILAHRRQMALENAQFYANQSAMEQRADRLINNL